MNGENTAMWTTAIGNAIGNIVTPIFKPYQDTATNAVYIDQAERIAMIVIIVGAIWYFSRKR